MTTTNRVFAASLVAAAAMTFSSAAWSLGLGDVTVESFLNQPLQVRIDLISRETDDLSSVSAKLASAADYELIGASRDDIPVPLRFSVEDIEGDAYILATSNLSIGSPVVRLIVEVNWSNGRLLREYTVFLDPPTHTDVAPIPRVNKRAEPTPVAAETTPEPAQSPSGTQTPAAQPDSTSTQARQPEDGEYGPVSRGETLWAISVDWSRGTGLDINKVMLAIQRENPDAFLKNNINLLKRGAILRMPRVDDVETISTASAISEVLAQTAEFRGRKPAEPAASPSTPLLAEEAAPYEPPVDSEQAEVIEPDSAASTEIVEQEPQTQDQLELVPPSEESDLASAYGFEESEDGSAEANVAVSTLREDLARTEEDLITQQQQNEYMAERIRELEAQLLAAEEDKVKDADLANMEERLRRERQAGQAAASSREKDKPWYRHFTVWLLGLLVLAAAVVGWWLSRRGGADEFVSELGSDDEPLRGIKDEAEEVLRVLEDSDEGDGDDDSGESADESGEDESKVKQFGASGDDAELLDEESSDPEIQLDLARAYISMGDKEAARVILDEVESNGNAEQREEAKKMLDMLDS